MCTNVEKLEIPWQDVRETTRESPKRKTAEIEERTIYSIQSCGDAGVIYLLHFFQESMEQKMCPSRLTKVCYTT